MKKMRLAVCLAVLVALASLQPAGAGENALSAGARYHVDHSVFVELPYGDGDLSYGLAYEYHDKAAYWQLGAGFAPDITGTNGVEYVITPHLNLVFKDSIWRAGLGVLGSYIQADDSADFESDWTDPYWQFLAGVDIPLAGLTLGARTFYVFEEWGDLSDFDFDDLEYGGWLRYTF